MKAKTFKIVAFSCAGVLLALMIAVTCVFSVFEPLISTILSSTKLSTEARAAGEALATQIQEEGIVMVRNEDNALPLNIDSNSEKSVAILGWSSTQYVQGGSGSGRSTNSGNALPNTKFLDAVKAAGITYDEAITNYYTSFCNARPFYDVGNHGSLSVHDYEYCRLIEPKIDGNATYQNLLNNAAQNYSTALVVITRISGESIDCPKAQYKNYTGTGTNPSKNALGGASVDTERTYLDISTEEEELLAFASNNFDKVIVLINNTNAMNLGFLEKDSNIDVDACLVTGGSGNNAVGGVINVLYGKKLVETKVEEDKPTVVVKYEGDEVKVTPSGRLTDTYVYDLSTNANYVNSAMEGVSKYTGINRSDNLYPFNGTTNGNTGSGEPSGEAYDGLSYLDYVEGIYVGYKWYETADAEGFWSSDEAKAKWGVSSYKDVVQYPFGYGMSYTTFEWAVRGWDVNDKEGTISVTVQVTNTGSVAGKEVVELYYTPEYTPGGLEKSAVNLGAFAKTPAAVEPGDTQELTLKLNIRDMASYNEKSGDGAYVLEKGNYTLTLRTDSHTLADVKTHNGSYVYKVSSDVIYDTDQDTGAEIRNLFGSDGSDGFAIDGSDSNQNITWLTRANFTGTFPFKKTAERAWESKLASINLYSQAAANKWDTDHANEPAITVGANNGIKVYDNGKVNDTGLDYGNPANYNNDEMWNKLLDQLTVNEMTSLALHGYTHEEALNSIGKPRTASYDGPAQIGSFNTTNAGVGYPNPTVLAQTWDTQLPLSFGMAVGQETRDTNRQGWYAPGSNLHRSAFGGRNYEYYSEDSYLSGIMCGQTVKGALYSGTYSYIKHVICYDQDSMRDGIYCWMTEQALRETYLKPFKMAIQSGATGLMSSYGRLGAVWAGGSRALLTDLLRDEWGFRGTVLSDYADHHDFMNGDQMVRAGGDIWMDGAGTNGSFRYSTTSNGFRQQLRLGAKHVIYMTLNAEYEKTQDHSAETTINVVNTENKNVFHWWTMLIVIADVLMVAGAGVLIFFGIRKKDKPVLEAAAENAEPAPDGDVPENVSTAETAENVEAGNAENETPAEEPETPSDEQ